MEQDSSSVKIQYCPERNVKKKIKTMKKFQLHICQKNIREISNDSVQAGKKRPQKFKLHQKQNV